MSPLLHALSIAQTTLPDRADTPSSAAVVLFAVPILTLLAVGVVAWVFWRAKRREDEARRDIDEQKKRELEWRNARSS